MLALVNGVLIYNIQVLDEVINAFRLIPEQSTIKLYMRLYLAPSASTSNKCDCQDLTKCVLPFNVDKIAFSNNFDFSNGIQP